MEEFLRETKHNLKSLDDFQKVRVVIGNEACDLDSAISALVYAYFLFKTNVNPSMAIIPVLNIPREDYGLRTEITFFLAQSDIQADLLIFRDEINLLQIHEDGRLMLTLVDHNVLTNGDEALEHAVVEVIDHHYKERDDDDERCEVTIEMVGSCCTLVAEKLLNKEPDLIDEKIANLLYGTILLDTVGLSMEAGRVTSKDEDVVRQLELSVRYPNPEELFQTLQNVKFDLSGLSLSQLLRKDVKVIQNATMNIAISSVPVLIEEFVKRSNIEKELESLCLKYNYNILVIMGIAVTTDNVTHRQIGIYSKIHGYRDQIIDVLESSDDPNLELELFDIGISTMSAFKQANTVSRKKVLPMLKTFLMGDTTPPEGTGFENTMLLSSESFSKLEITGRDVSEEFDSGDSQLDSREECESPLEFAAQLPDNPDSSSNFLDFSDGGIDNPAFTASVEEPNLECDGSGCPSRDPPSTSPYDPFTTITVNNPDNEPVLLLYDADSEPPEASNSSSNQDTCPATPASSFVDGNFDEVTEQHLPSFNSREMTDIIETKKAKLGGYELDPSNQTYPFTPKNSFVDSSLETLRGELPDFDSESILQKIHEKKMSFEAFDSEDGDENVFTDPSDSSVDFDALNLSSKSQPLNYNPKELHSYSKFVHSDESSLSFSRDYKGPGHSIHRDSFGDDLINAEFIKTFSQQISSESENGFGDKFAETFSMQVEIDGMPAEVIQRRQSKDILGDLLRRESKPGVDGITRDCLDPVLSPGSYGGKGDAADSGYIDLSNGESSSEIHKFSPDDMMSTEDVDSEKIFEQGGNSTDDNPGAFSGTEEQAYRTSQGSSADWPTKQTNDDGDDSSYEEEDETQQASVQDCVDTRTQGITNLAFEDDDEGIAGQSGNNLEAQSAIIVGKVLKQSENIVKKSTETSISIGQTCYHPLMSSLDLESQSAAIVQNVLKEGEKMLTRTIGQSDKSPDKISSEGTEDDSTSDTLPSEVSPDKGTLGVGGWGDMSASVISESQKTEGDPFTSSIEMDSSMEYLGTLHGKKLHGGLMGDNHFYEHSEFDFEIPISRLPSGIGMVSIAESETKADSDELVDSVETVRKNELPTDKNGNALPDVAKRKFDYRNERDGCVFVEVDTHAMKEIYHTTAGLISLPLEINEHSRLDDLANDSVLPPKDNPLLPNPYQLDENLLAAADKLIEMTEAAKTSGHGLGLQTRPLRLPHPPSDINELSSYSEFLTCEFDNQSVQCDLTKEQTSLDTNKSLADQSMDEGANYELETIDFPQSPNRLNLRVQLETSQEYNKEEANISYQDENEIPEEIALQAGLSPVTEDGIKPKQVLLDVLQLPGILPLWTTTPSIKLDHYKKSGRPTSLSTSCANKKKKKIIVSPDAFKDKEDDHMSLHSNSELDLASPVDDSGTPDDLETPEDLDDSLLQDDWDDKPKISEKIPELSAEEELEEERSWRTVILAGKQHKIDMKVIEPYKKVLSHGGYYGSGLNAIIVFTACYLPDRGRKDYDYVMDNLFLYVISTLDLLVAEDYILVYLHGATPRRNVPSFGWLKRCYQMIDRRLRKNLKGLYLVHPTFWLKTIVVMTRPFISTKFSSKLRFVSSLKELGELIPLEYVYIPDKIQQYDEQKYGLQ